jgi:Skp family chaperone for outer membrane proteins
MNRWFPAAGVLLAGAVLVFVGRSWSDGKSRPAAARPRVAVVNLSYVLKNYEKFKTLQDGLRAKVAPLEKRSRALQTQAESLKKDHDAPDIQPDKREQIERTLLQVQRQLEDFQVEARAQIRKEEEKTLLELYADVGDAAASYAKAHGIELVLQYSDAAPDNPAELNQPFNVSRKVQSQACLPLYAASGVDVSRELIAALNEKLRRPGGTR